MIDAKEVLETGTFHGYSTSILAAAVRDNGGGRVTTVDPWTVPHLWEGTELEPYIEWLPKPSQEASAELQGREFDALVIDSEHTYRQASLELQLFEPMLRNGGVMFLHDSLFHDGVGCAAGQLCSNPRFECVTFDTPRRLQTHTIAQPVPMGMTIIRKKAAGPALPRISELLELPEHVPDGPAPVLRQMELEYRGHKL